MSKQVPETHILSGDRATVVRRRLPPRNALPELPNRTTPIEIDTQSQYIIAPPTSAFVLTTGDSTIEDGPIHVLLDSTGDILTTWCTTTRRYIAYTTAKFGQLVSNGNLKLLLEDSF